MTEQTRRRFLNTAGAGVAGTLVAGEALAANRAAGANERIQLGVIGAGGRGSGVARAFAGEKNCEVTWVCDPDAGRAGKLAAALTKVRGNRKPAIASDLRKVLDDSDVDAVLVATPDHWHAPAAILACNAGKHVYVEKPCSHNLREGRLLVEAARKNKRVVQHGTQSRNMRLIVDAMQMLREGIIGDVLMAKAWNVQRRRNIGHKKPGAVPKGVDYDQWVGPAAWMPFQANRFHYDWHWWHNFGTGDMGNDGVHELDIARWGLGVDTHPIRIAGLGTKLYFDDDQQFPDTQTITFEYPGNSKAAQKRMLVWEMRIWSRNYPQGIDNGAEFYGTKGRMVLSKRGQFQVFADRDKRIKPSLKGKQRDLKSHHVDFLDCIGSGRKPNAEIEIGHLSASLCHLGNIATRLGRALQFDPNKEQIIGDEPANALLSRTYRKGGHWAIPKGV